MSKIFEAARGGNKVTVDLGNGQKVYGFITQAESTMIGYPECNIEIRVTDFSRKDYRINRKILIV